MEDFQSVADSCILVGISSGRDAERPATIASEEAGRGGDSIISLGRSLRLLTCRDKSVRWIYPHFVIVPHAIVIGDIDIKWS